MEKERESNATLIKEGGAEVRMGAAAAAFLLAPEMSNCCSMNVYVFDHYRIQTVISLGKESSEMRVIKIKQVLTDMTYLPLTLHDQSNLKLLLLYLATYI